MMSEPETLHGPTTTTAPSHDMVTLVAQPPEPEQPPPPDMTPAETQARWRNYQRLIWTQQQIHRQIQQQQSLNSKRPEGDAGGEVAVLSHGLSQRQGPETQDKTLEEKLKDGPDAWGNFDAQAAFLGPILWDKRVPYDGSDFKLEYVDLEEFLTENGIPFDPSLEASFAVWKPVEQGTDATGPSGPITSSSPPAPFFLASQFMPGSARDPVQIHNVSHTRDNNLSHQVPQSRSRSPSPCSSSIDSQSMSQEGTPAVSPDSTQLTELHPAAVPGHEFDPRIRAFTDDELKPQPMVKKSRKQFIPDEQKDTRYWARRRKNNLAAKRSRDARRMKENQIAMRACFLEKENHVLKQEMERLQAENLVLKEQLSRYH